MTTAFFRVIWGVTGRVIALGCVIGLAMLGGCRPEPAFVIPVVEYGREYYPLRVGAAATYRIDTMAFNVLSEPRLQVGTFLERERIDSAYIGLTGDSTWRIAIERGHALNALRLDRYDLIFKVGAGERWVRRRGNESIVVLETPFRPGTTWDGDRFNGGQTTPRTFRVSGPGPDTVLGVNYPARVRVTQERDSSCLSEAFTFEDYAPGLGLIRRQERTVVYVQDPLNPCQEPLVAQRSRTVLIRRMPD